MASVMGKVCEVWFRDGRGLRHAVEVSADSLYEAGALALKAFRESGFAGEMRPGGAVELSVSARSDCETHQVRVSQIESWVYSAGKTPREQVLKTRLRERLGPARERTAAKRPSRRFG